MQNKKKEMNLNTLYKVFIYVALLTLAVSIVIPVGWVFLASIKENSEFYGNPWTMPKGFYFQNFIDAFEKANMGEYFFNSILVTMLALAILLVVALPAAYVLARYRFFGSKLINIMFMGGLFINVNYIVVPIFLMFVDADKFLKSLGGNSFFLNNLFVVALVYASTALPFTIYLLSGFFVTTSADQHGLRVTMVFLCPFLPHMPHTGKGGRQHEWKRQYAERMERADTASRL